MKTYKANEEAKKLAEENMTYIVMMMEMAYNRGYTAGMKKGGDIAMFVQGLRNHIEGDEHEDL